MTMPSAPLPAAPLIVCENLVKIYKVADLEMLALQGLDLTVQRGELMGIVGASGSGKTTLLNCLGGLDKPTAGTILVNGRSLTTMDDHALTTWRQREVGFIFQSFGLLPTLSAYENVELMLRIGGAPGRERRQRALDCLELVGLGKWADHRPYEMSGGQQQRVAIARAIANRPRLILADEATGELDSDTAREVLALFQTIVKQDGLTMLLAPHDSLVDEYADQVLHLQNSQIMAAKLNL
jgi:putative ABC transport system ATP-binding protein